MKHLQMTVSQGSGNTSIVQHLIRTGKSLKARAYYTINWDKRTILVEMREQQFGYLAGEHSEYVLAHARYSLMMLVAFLEEQTQEDYSFVDNVLYGSACLGKVSDTSGLPIYVDRNMEPYVLYKEVETNENGIFLWVHRMRDSAVERFRRVYLYTFKMETARELVRRSNISK